MSLVNKYLSAVLKKIRGEAVKLNDLQSIASAIKAAQVISVVGGTMNQTHGGIELNVSGRRGGGGGKARCPFAVSFEKETGKNDEVKYWATVERNGGQFLDVNGDAVVLPWDEDSDQDRAKRQVDISRKCAIVIEWVYDVNGVVQGSAFTFENYDDSDDDEVQPVVDVLNWEDKLGKSRIVLAIIVLKEDAVDDEDVEVIQLVNTSLRARWYCGYVDVGNDEELPSASQLAEASVPVVAGV